VLLVVATLISWLHKDEVALATPRVPRPPNLPFSFQQKNAPTFGPPFLSTQEHSLVLRLPDLRNTFMYHGSNFRPDITDNGSLVNIGIRGQQSSLQVQPNTPVYLAYNARAGGLRWGFSPDNTPTNVWVEIAPKEASAEFSVFLKQNETLVQEPEEFTHFTVAQLHIPATIRGGANWEIGGLRVDSSLLLRQKAMWHGQDLFLQQQGGKLYQDKAYKERVDFPLPEGGSYPIYVSTGDCFIFTENRWQEVAPGPESRSKPLLVARKVDERNISFDLWDEEGKNRISLELHKSVNPVQFNPNLNLKLIGARSKQDWIISLHGVRMLIREDDWLLYREGKWQKITDIETLDAYIEGSIKGILLTLDGTEKNGNDVSLVGTLFDESRSRVHPVKISLFKSLEKPQKRPPIQTSEDESDDDDDDDDEYDDDDDEDFDEDDLEDFEDDDDEE